MSDTVIQPRPVGHPLAGQHMSGARMIMQVLADEGVTAIFGYSGGAILPTYDAVFLYNEQAARAGHAPGVAPVNTISMLGSVALVTEMVSPSLH